MFNMFTGTKCPGCQLDKKFSTGTKFKMCSKCSKQGYDYAMFTLKNGDPFMVVYLDPKQKTE